MKNEKTFTINFKQKYMKTRMLLTTTGITMLCTVAHTKPVLAFNDSQTGAIKIDNGAIELKKDKVQVKKKCVLYKAVSEKQEDKDTKWIREKGMDLLLNREEPGMSHRSKKAEKETVLSEKSKEWINKKGGTGFLENKGQMQDMEGNPVPFVLFKAESNGLNVWITERGITLQAIKVEEKEGEKERERERREGKIGEEEEIEIKWERVDIELKGASIKKENIIKEGAGITNFNYFYPHCPDGIYGVKEYEKITIKEVYPGIDWVLYNNKEKGYKYDFVVHPGGDYKNIQLIYKSKEPIKINADGEIELYTRYGNVKEQSPVSYCSGKEIETKFALMDQKPILINKDKGYESYIGFVLVGGNFDLSTSDLVIDPQLYWATFYGGSGLDGPMSIDTDTNGNVFVTGYTDSTNFPVQNAGTFFQGTNAGGGDAFILKFNNSGTRLWATYYGAFGSEYGNSIATDNTGNVFVTGWTYASFPGLPLQNAGTFFQGTHAGLRDVFILKFDNSGNRLWATYYGGSGSDYGYSIATDNTGNVFVTGWTDSTDFPVQNAGTFFQGTNAGSWDVFILKFDNAGNRLWATYYGGSGDDYGYSIATDNTGNVFVTGSTGSTDFPVQNAGTFFQGTFAGGTYDAFILKFDNSGTRLWATYYGGSGGAVGSGDEGLSIVADNTGNVFVMGYTQSANFPVQNAGTFFQGTLAGGYDAFILKFDNSGTRLWATYYGGSGIEYAGSLTVTYDHLAIDNCGNVYLSVETYSNPFPYLQNSCDAQYFDNTYNGNIRDVLLSIFSNTGNLLWATYFGGDGADFRSSLAVDGNNNLFVSGEWSYMGTSINSATYPVTNPGGSTYYDPTYNGYDDGFIAKFLSAPCLCSVLNVNVTSTNVPCNAQCVGTATANPVGGTAPYTYNWLPGGMSTQVVSGLCAGSYTVSITDAASNTATAVVSITEPPAITVAVSGSTITCVQSSGSATVTASGGTGSYTYSWIPSGSTGSVVTGLSAGTHTVEVKDGNNCIQTETVAIVSNTTAPSITAASSGSLNCTTNTVLVSTTVTPSSGVSYNWSGTGIVSGNGTGTITVNQGGTYQLTVTNTANGCTATASQAVTQNTTAPTLAAAANGTLNCINSTVSITSTVSPSSVSYTWSGSGIVSGNGTGTITVNQPGTYTLVVTDPVNSCTASVTNINVLQNTVVPIVSAGSNQTLTCSTPSVSLVGSSNPSVGVSINWLGGVCGATNSYTTAACSAGTYTLEVTDNSNGCVGSSQVQVIPDSNLPSVAVAPSGSLNCSVNSVQVVASTTVSPVSYTWSGSGITGGNGTGTITVNQGGAYQLTVTNTSNGCSTTTMITVTENTTAPSVVASATGTLDCNNTTIQISSTVNPTSVSYTWSGTGIVSGNGTGTITVNQPGTYTLVITDPANSCTASVTNINVLQNTVAPIVSAGSNQTLTCSTPSVLLAGSSTPSVGVSINWLGGVCGATNSYTTIACVVGIYTLEVSDNSSGCVGSSTVQLIGSNEVEELFVPNIFSPNGDGVNDVFCVMGTSCMKEFKIEVYDRWGEKVYESTDAKGCWDGKYRGSALNGAVFVYHLSGVLWNGEVIRQKGNVTLIR